MKKRATLNRATQIGVLSCALALLGACDRGEEADSTAETSEGTEVTRPMAPPGSPSGTVTEAPEGTAAEPMAEAEEADDDDPTASADIEAAEGAEIDGEAEFFTQADGVRVVVEVEDAPPGMKGVHIHEKGDCSDIAGKSMGSHFAPKGDKHALPSELDEAGRHLGDLGNMEVGEDGKGRLEAVVASANLKEGDPMSFLGKAVVVHSGSDSGQAKQPAGDSGKPMGCGVIN